MLGAKPTGSGWLEHAEPGAPGPRPGLFSVGSLSGIHVLLIDDDPASREELTAILRYCGSLVTVAESDAEAIRVLSIARPDVIVVAVARRHRGEIPFVQLVRGHAAYEAGSIPIIAIVWPDDAVNVAGAIVLELRRPLDAWEVCRALSTAVTVE
jgi:CheY-like chemotaxis protein